MMYSFLRVTCKRYFENNLIKLCGEGAVCQVDESMITYKSKHHQAEHWKPTDGYVHCLVITVYKKCKIVLVRYKIQAQYNLYLKREN
jgi:hypothetical protein